MNKLLLALIVISAHVTASGTSDGFVFHNPLYHAAESAEHINAHIELFRSQLNTGVDHFKIPNASMLKELADPRNTSAQGVSAALVAAGYMSPGELSARLGAMADEAKAIEAEMRAQFTRRIVALERERVHFWKS